MVLLNGSIYDPPNDLQAEKAVPSKLTTPSWGPFYFSLPIFSAKKKQWILSNQSCSSASKMLLEKDSNLLCDLFSFRNWTHHNLVFHQTSNEYTFLNYHRHKSSARLKGDRFVFVNWSHQQGKSRCLVRSNHGKIIVCGFCPFALMPFCPFALMPFCPFVLALAPALPL